MRSRLRGWLLAVTAVAFVGCGAPERAVAPSTLAAAGRASHEPAGALRTEAERGGGEPRRARLPAAVTRFRSVRSHRGVAAPAALRIPAIGVDTSLERLGRRRDGSVEVPADWDRAGWYAHGARPGQPGPAVILGHVDSRRGPAVFARLSQLRPGDLVVVSRRDGSRARFRVDRLERHSKRAFPTERVYLPTLAPTLRLVTCGGPFDSEVGHYRDNVIAFATLQH